MPLIFSSVTTIEFASREDLEVFVETMPLDSEKIRDLLLGETIIDDQDQAQVTGAGKTVHKFSIEGEE